MPTHARAGHSDEEIDRDMALAYMGLRPSGRSGSHLPGSDDPAWLDRESPPPTVHVLSEDEPAPARPEVRAPPPLGCRVPLQWRQQVSACGCESLCQCAMHAVQDEEQHAAPGVVSNGEQEAGSSSAAATGTAAAGGAKREPGHTEQLNGGVDASSLLRAGGSGRNFLPSGVRLCTLTTALPPVLQQEPMRVQRLRHQCCAMPCQGRPAVARAAPRHLSAPGSSPWHVVFTCGSPGWVSMP